MKRIFVLQGLPASGKSTLAQKIIAGNPSAVRVNKDSLRKMLFGWQRDRATFDKAQERLVQQTEDKMIADFVQRGLDVVVDDTNLNPKRIKQLAEMGKRLGVAVIFIPMKAGIAECIQRNATRLEPVPQDAIVVMGLRYGYEHSA